MQDSGAFYRSEIDMMADNVTGSFIRYVSRNVVGMLGISAYVLVDVFFIAQCTGSDGIAALNIVLPLFNILFALGALIGIGSAIRFQLESAAGEENAGRWFCSALTWCLLAGLVFTAAGLFCPSVVVALLGGRDDIIANGTVYARIVLLFGPAFLLNYVINGFVRNDGAPTLAMISTFSSSIFNILLDYVTMVRLGMGLAGGALATSLSPLVGIVICMVHFTGRRGTLKLRLCIPDIRLLIGGCRLGGAAAVVEVANGLVVYVFNILILGITGTIGVAAYGVIANISQICIAVFNGAAQGAQPLVSEAKGREDAQSLRHLRRLLFGTSFVMSAMVAGVIIVGAVPLTAMFNSENNAQMAAIAEAGIPLYFSGLVLAALNVAGTAYLSSVGRGGEGFFLQLLRGVILIIACAVMMSRLWGIAGVWLSFPAAEALTLAGMITVLRKSVSAAKV